MFLSTIILACLLFLTLCVALTMYRQREILRRKIFWMIQQGTSQIKNALHKKKYEEAATLALWALSGVQEKLEGGITHEEKALLHDFQDLLDEVWIASASQCFMEAHDALSLEQIAESQEHCRRGLNMLNNMSLYAAGAEAVTNRIVLLREYIAACGESSSNVAEKNRQMLALQERASRNGFALPNFDKKLREVWRATLAGQICVSASEIRDLVAVLLMSARALPEGNLTRSLLEAQVESIQRSVDEIGRIPFNVDSPS